MNCHETLKGPSKRCVSGAKVGGDCHDRDIRMTVVKGRQRGVVGTPVLTILLLGAGASADVGTGEC